jgi:hypothetical protein
MEESPPIWRVAANTFNTYSGTADKGIFLSLYLDDFLTTPHHKYLPFYLSFSIPSSLNLIYNSVNAPCDGHLECREPVYNQGQLLQ